MKRVDSPRVKILYDINHAQIMDGDIVRTIRDNVQWIGHFHTGGNPRRHEIDETPESHYHFDTVQDIRRTSRCRFERTSLDEPV